MSAEARLIQVMIQIWRAPEQKPGSLCGPEISIPLPSNPYANLSQVSKAYGINQGHPVKGGELALAILSNGNQSAPSRLGLKAKVTAIKQSRAQNKMAEGPGNQFNFNGQPMQRQRLSLPIREGQPGAFNANPSQIRNRPRDEKGTDVS